MPWFNVDDNLCFHPKAMAAGNAAMGLWVRAGSWSMQNLTEGFIRDDVARTLGTAQEIKALVAAGLWERSEKDAVMGYLFHEWDTRQRSKAQVQSEREQARIRKQRSREKAEREAAAAAVAALNGSGHAVTLRQVPP